MPVRPTGLLRGGRPLKEWHYVGVWGPEVMLCAASVRIAGVPQCFWAVWDRTAGVLHERTRPGGRAVRLGPGRLEVRDGDVEVRLELEEDTEPIEVVNPHGRQEIWTRKAGLRAQGVVSAGGRRVEVACRGLRDESAGHHARVTRWRWAAGVGEDEAGTPLTWNLVEGVHDGAEGSERHVWRGRRAVHVPPVPIAQDLGSAGGLRFAAEAERARHDRLVLFASRYRQPFGTAEGELPDGSALRRGFGVMEDHEARW